MMTRRLFHTLGISLIVVASACGEDDPSTDAGALADAGLVPDAGPADTGTADTGATPDLGASEAGRAWCQGYSTTSSALTTVGGDCELFPLPAVTTDAQIETCAVIADSCAQATLDWIEAFYGEVASCLSSAPACESASSTSWSTMYLDGCSQQAVLAHGRPPWGEDPDCQFAP